MDLHDSLHEIGEHKSFNTSSDQDDDDKQNVGSSGNDDESPNSPYYSTDHEKYLQQLIFHLIFNFDPKNWTNASPKKADNKSTPITYHYRFITSTSYQMRAYMPFKQNHNQILDYYRYLRSGYNDDDMTWTNNSSTNKIIKIFDKSHQLMYNKGDGGILNYIISPRDTCYIRSRFKELSYEFKQTKYDIVGSLHYSVNDDHPFYYPFDPKCVRVDMKFRGFILKYNTELKETELFYVAYFDIKGNIPQWISEQGIKGIAPNYIKAFNDSWTEKIKNLKQREKEEQTKELKNWLIDTVGLPQYIDTFINNGFEDLSFFNHDLKEQDLKDVGIKLKGHRMKIISEIRKL